MRLKTTWSEFDAKLVPVSLDGMVARGYVELSFFQPVTSLRLPLRFATELQESFNASTDTEHLVECPIVVSKRSDQ